MLKDVHVLTERLKSMDRKVHRKTEAISAEVRELKSSLSSSRLLRSKPIMTHKEEQRRLRPRTPKANDKVAKGYATPASVKKVVTSSR
jgi:hypothetical protein